MYPKLSVLFVKIANYLKFSKKKRNKRVLLILKIFKNWNQMFWNSENFQKTILGNLFIFKKIKLDLLEVINKIKEALNILYIKANVVSVCLWWQTRQGRAAKADTRPQHVIFSYTWKSNNGGVCLCGQCLEDFSNHCPFLVELPQM